MGCGVYEPSYSFYPFFLVLPAAFVVYYFFLSYTKTKIHYKQLNTLQELYGMDRTVYEACSDLIVEFGTHVVSADEVLAEKVDHLVPVPFKTREDLEADSAKDRAEGLFEGEIVPRIDLRVLHYFATQLIVQRYPHLVRCFDETSMITLGLLVEKWVRDFLVEYESGRVKEGPSQCVSKAVNYRVSPSNI